VHPILADRRRATVYLAAAVPLAAATAAVLTRGPNAMRIVDAVLLAVPLAVLALGLMLPAWYACRALPAEGGFDSRLVATHAFGAALTSTVWVYLGASLARVLSAYNPEADLPRLYRFHVPGLLAGGALLYLLSVSVHYMLIAVEATRHAEQRALELAVLAREAELRALKAQVHPHFLFNSLNSISSLVTHDPARAREMCILLAEFFRRTLALGDKTSVSLEEELAVVRTYLAIEAMRLGTRLSVEESVEEAVKAWRVPPLLLQPLVENAIRHGIATRPEGGVLRLEARAEGRKLRLLVENPFDPDAPARPGVGIGLSNVRGRLQARYGEGAVLDAQRQGDRFRVVMVMAAEVGG
jgi:two-component system, LytTR family, sensor histidine kinase AlgZ